MLNDLTRAAALDPLNLDAACRALPDHTEDTRWLLEQLAGALPRAAGLRGARAQAALRDLGLLSGALIRLGAQPAEHLAELPATLTALSGSPPRDTILHYTVANPSGPRQRTFTGTQEEASLIGAVRSAAGEVWRAVTLLDRLSDIPPRDVRFVPLCRAVDEELSATVCAIARARRAVPPAFFAQRLRAFFDPLVLDGAEWEGPGAVQLPMFLIDHLLWSARSGDPVLAAYAAERLRYVPALRPAFLRGARGGSVLERVLAAPTPQALSAMDQLMTTLLRFRMPHHTLARKAYAASAGNPRAAGSGGHGTPLLDHLAQATLAARTRLRGTTPQARAPALA